VRLEIIKQARIGVYFSETEPQTRANENYGRGQNWKWARPKSLRRFGFDDFAFAWHRPPQKRRIHHISAGESHHRSEHAAESELAQRLGFDNQQAGKTERCANHR